MRRTTPRLAWMAAMLLTLGLVAGACGDDKQDDADSGSGSDSTTTTAVDYDYASLSGTLNGSGSSFQDTFEQKAKTEFAKVASGVTVNYTKSGSSAGKQDLANQVVQFAGTDSLIKDADLGTFKGGDVLYFPIVAAPITVSFNLDGVDELKLTPETVAGIFQGEITKWDAEEIATDNPDADLPSEDIVVVHRSDGSGTTSNFTKYLDAAADNWTLGSGDTVPWPATTQGAEKNSGVATLIGSTPGAIGYVDLSDAVVAKLSLAEIENAAGKFIAPTLDGASAALDGAALEDNLTYDPLNAPGDTAYPITSPTWIIVYAKQPDAGTAEALKGYLNFILTEGQSFAQSVGYAKLPDAMAQAAIAQLDQISA